MDNYYNLFNITNSSSTDEIIIAYEKKITIFNNIEYLTQTQINDIKLIKTGLYILTNPELRIMYDKILNNNLCNTNKQTDTIDELNNTNKQTDTIDELNNTNKQTDTIDELNNTNNKHSCTLDELFNVDNSWMHNQPKQDYNGRKNKIESNTYGDRVFSLSQFNKKPNYSSEFESQLRKPHQGRIDKTNL
jgi:hypothetical protein